MARGTRSALVLAVAVLAAAVAFLGREGARGEQSHGAPPGLVRQFVCGGKWKSQARIGSLTHWSIDSLGDQAAGSLTDSGNESMTQSPNGSMLGFQVQLKHLEDGSLAGRVHIVGHRSSTTPRSKGRSRAVRWMACCSTMAGGKSAPSAARSATGR